MSDDLRWLAPRPAALPETLAVHQLTYEFRQEVADRAAFSEYCAWYRRTAAEHQAELRKMQNDLNVFGWFVRGRSS